MLCGYEILSGVNIDRESGSGHCAGTNAENAIDNVHCNHHFKFVVSTAPTQRVPDRLGKFLPQNPVNDFRNW